MQQPSSPHTSDASADGAASAPASFAAAAAPVQPRAPPSKARWGLLKRALVKSAVAQDVSGVSAADALSVRRHQGFKVLHQRTLTFEEVAQLKPPHFDAQRDDGKYLFVQYDLPPLFDVPSAAAASAAACSIAAASSSVPSVPRSLHFRLRRASSVSLAELAPDQKIDNTGNICVWNSEEVLTYITLKLLARDGSERRDGHTAADNTLPRSLFVSSIPGEPARPLRILELGAGMSGLCGLALAAAAADASSSAASAAALASSSGSASPLITPLAQIGEVIITDGNAACVDAIRYQIEWNAQQQAARSTCSTGGSFSAAVAAAPPSPRVSAALLAWDRSGDYSSLGSFDVILVADCLFFEEFHEDLMHVLRSLLRSDTGRAWMLAPTRGGSLARFVQRLKQQAQERAAAAPQEPQLYVQHELERYDDAIWQQHQSFLAAEAAAAAASSGAVGAAVPVPSYVVDLHYPLLLSIQLRSPQTDVKQQ